MATKGFFSQEEVGFESLRGVVLQQGHPCGYLTEDPKKVFLDLLRVWTIWCSWPRGYLTKGTRGVQQGLGGRRSPR